MTYSVGTIAKALMAFVTAFGGAAATSAPHDPVTWAGCVGAGLVAFAAVFATPNKAHDTVSAADQVINNIPVVVQNATDAISELDRVKQAATDALAQVPVLGPLAQAAINSLPKI